MAAPTPVVRGTPAGIPLGNSFPVKVALGGILTVSFWEKSITGIGYDGGDTIDQTTMHNVLYRTKFPRALIDTTPLKGKAAYDPNVLEQLKTRINIQDTITKTFADGSSITFYGYLKSFMPTEEAGDGTQPEADFEIVPTNWDYINHVEAAPVITSVSGT